MKKALAVLVVILLLVGGGTWYFATFHMDSMIEKKIETAASISLGSRVSVGEVKTDIKGGSLTISEVTVANPPGFKNQNAFVLNGIEAAVDYANFDIKRLVIDKPEIIVEELGGETNFTRMLAGLEKSSPGSQPAPSADGKPEPVITIRHFRMNESRAAFESESLDRYTDLKVDAVELNNIKGTPTEVANIIAAEIVSEISKEAAVELLKAKASEKIDGFFGKKKD